MSESSKLIIVPTKAEQEFFELCLEAAAHSKRGTIIRVVGGWVRDKLLGLQSDDVDIAVDNCSGVEFAECINSYLESNPGKGPAKGVKVAVIKANPDQSKHLETATVRLKGIEVDITNLRTETYVGDSRIPEIKIGTAQEDSLRRDLTINALFYNLNAREVLKYL